MYAAFMDSTKQWDRFNDGVLGLRAGYRILRGGLQMASDFMPQGELITIPLKKAVGYQHNTHVIVHFSDGSPDLGRKTFQPEFNELAAVLATQAVKALIQFRSLLRPDTGSPVVTPDLELHEWKREQENWRDTNPLTIPGANIPVLSKPRQEQDVVALFNQMVGAGIFRGIEFLGSTFNERYDGLFRLSYEDSEKFRYDRSTNPLGVGVVVDLPHRSEPKVLEYKFDFDSLTEDFDKEVKFAKHIDLVVCWTATGEFSSKYELKPLLPGTNGNDRVFFGSTHAAYRVGGDTELQFEVVILDDLIRYLCDAESEGARQRTLYCY